MADRKVVATAGNVATFEITVKDRDELVKATFDACKDYASFKAYVGALSDKAPAEGKVSPLEDAYERYIYGMDLRARATARESVAAESTVVTRGKERIDIFALPIERAVGAINAAYTEVAMLGGKPGTAFVVTRRKLLEAGKAVEVNGMLSVKK